MSFKQFNLSPHILKSISEKGYSLPTPVQEQAIPIILQGKDILAGAQTGTGKTAGFALPLLQLIQNQQSTKKHKPISALVLTPTRELAIQVCESFKVYGKHTPVCTEVVYGGVSINAQIKRLRSQVDILVATPGRLIDLVNQKYIDLSQVQFFVLDEADRMLDMGFIKDIRKISKLLRVKRQNLMFSATYSKDIKLLASQLLNNPVEVAVAKENATADNISQRVYPIKKEHKRDLISWLIGDGNWQQVLVFVRTKHGANRLCKQLIKDGIRCAALHGDKSQGARTKALEAFKQGEIKALIATDIASRGLDINQLPYVVNYDLPAVAEDYVHRIGRCGRAGATGIAVSLVTTEEAHLLAAIEKLLDKKIPQIKDTGYEPVSLKLENKKNTKPKPNQNTKKSNKHHKKKVSSAFKKQGTENKKRKQS